MFFNIESVKANKKAILAEMATSFNWTEEQGQRYEEELNIEIVRATTAL